MPTSYTFTEGELLTAAKLNTHAAHQVPNDGDPFNTDWVTSGVSIAAETGWTVDSYLLRRRGIDVKGRIIIYRDSNASALTPNSSGVDTGNFTDNPICTLPAAWANGAPHPITALLIREGVATAFYRIDAQSGRIVLTHGIPGVVIAPGQKWIIQLDHPAA